MFRFYFAKVFSGGVNYLRHHNVSATTCWTHLNGVWVNRSQVMLGSPIGTRLVLPVSRQLVLGYRWGRYIFAVV